MANVLIKPRSERDGRLVIPIDNTRSLSIIDLNSGQIIEQGRLTGTNQNGRDSTIRFSQAGGAYNNVGLMDDKGNVVGTFKTLGSRITYNYDDYDALVRTPVSTIEGLRWDNSANLNASREGRPNNNDIGGMSSEDYLAYLDEETNRAAAEQAAIEPAVSQEDLATATALGPNLFQAKLALDAAGIDQDSDEGRAAAAMSSFGFSELARPFTREETTNVEDKRLQFLKDQGLLSQDFEIIDEERNRGQQVSDLQAEGREVPKFLLTGDENDLTAEDLQGYAVFREREPNDDAARMALAQRAVDAQAEFGNIINEGKGTIDVAFDEFLGEGSSAPVSNRSGLVSNPAEPSITGYSELSGADLAAFEANQALGVQEEMMRKQMAVGLLQSSPSSQISGQVFSNIFNDQARESNAQLGFDQLGRAFA